MINFLLKFRYFFAGIAVLLAIGVLALALRAPNVNTPSGSWYTLDKSSPVKVVKLKSVRELSLDSARKSIIGTVRSLSEADLRAERAGTITNIYAKPGSRVHAGAIVARISNAVEAAGVLSARAQVESAQARVVEATASLNKVKGGARREQLAILNTGSQNAQSALDEALVSAKNTIASAYATAESAVVRTADQMFIGTDSASSRLSFESVNYSQRISANNQRMALQVVIDRQRGATILLNTLTTQEKVLNELIKTEDELRKIKLFLDTLLIALDGSIQTSANPKSLLDTYKLNTESARVGIIGSLSALSGARAGISSANSALQIAKENEKQAVAGAQNEDIEAAEAALALARAGLSSARAGLLSATAVYEKTLIRTPINGVLTTFSLKAGDFVNMYESVGTVANEGTLEVLTYVSSSEAQMLNKGDAVVVDKKYTGTITNVASGLSQQLHQVEVRISLDTSITELVHGESVAVEFMQKSDIDTRQISVPISVVKFEANTVVVFSVNDENMLTAHKVELGEINGDLVEIKNGLTLDMQIVTDVRGLYEGQAVIVKQ